MTKYTVTLAYNPAVTGLPSRSAVSVYAVTPDGAISAAMRLYSNLIGFTAGIACILGVTHA